MSDSTAPHADLEKTVSFEHPFFASFDEIYFRLTEDNVPVAVTKLGKTFEAVLPLDGIRKQYDIKIGSRDDRMLRMVEQSLHYLTAITLDEEIPSEITCGKPSWSPKPRHFMIAKQRLSLQLVTWMTGNENVITSADQLVMMADDPQTKKNINLAFGDAAVELGLERDQRDQVIEKIEAIAKELAYVEAMRDIFAEIKKIDEKLQGFRLVFSSDKTMGDTVDQLARLSQRCLRKFDEQFEQIDAQTGEVMSILKNLRNQLDYIHKVTDELYRRLHPWEYFIDRWKSLYVTRSMENTPYLRELYRFMAPRFMVFKEWALMGKLNDSSAKPLGGTMRW